MNFETTLVLVRHGQIVWSATSRRTGGTDVALMSVGEAQARWTGEALAGWAFAAVLTSPRLRAMAQLAGLELARTSEDLRVCLLGREHDRPVLRLWNAAPGDPAPGGSA